MNKSAELLGITEERYRELDEIAKKMLGDKLVAEVLIELNQSKDYTDIEKLYMASKMGSQNMKNIFSED